MEAKSEIKRTSLSVEYDERRKRLKRPSLLLLIAIGFIFAPVINITFNSLYYDYPFLIILKEFPLPALIILGICPFIGLGLLSLSKWAWYFFAFFSLTAIGYNIYRFFAYPSSYNTGILIFSIIILVITGYFLRRDIYAPFLTDDKRGFRSTKRYSTEVFVIIDKTQYRTIDISSKGLSVKWPSCPKKTGDEVSLSFLLHSKPIELKGGITRIKDDEVAIAFRNISKGEIDPNKLK
jgi:hypothetical protein